MEKRSLKKYFDKVYVINYIEGKERREIINQMFSDYGLIDDIEFIYGMPFGKISAIKPLFEQIAKMTPRNVGSVNTIGCSFSHYTAIKTAYELGYNTVLVIEDDVIIRNNIDLIFDYLDTAPKDWNYLYFTLVYASGNVKVTDLNLFKDTSDKWINMKNLSIGQLHDFPGVNNSLILSSGVYAMDRKAMNLFIKMFENDNRILNSDMLEYFYHNVSQSPLNMYTTKERLFATNNELGSIKIENNQYKISQFLISNSEEVSKTNFKYTLDEKDNSIVDNLRKQS